MRNAISFSSFLAITYFATTANAAVVPFTEDFDSDSANWFNAPITAPVGWASTGGPDGGAYATTTANFQFNGVNDMPPLFRGEESFGSSGNAFVGDWITEGVTEFSFAIRHNATSPLTFFARFAPSAAPGANAVEFVPVLPNVWTTITVAINPATMFFYEGTTFETTFNNLGRVQIGLFGLDGIAGVDQTFTFDLDKPSIIPAPPVAGLMGFACLAFTRRRR